MVGIVHPVYTPLYYPGYSHHATLVVSTGTADTPGLSCGGEKTLGSREEVYPGWEEDSAHSSPFLSGLVGDSAQSYSASQG